MPLERKSLVDQVEAALLSEIEQGRWRELLPGLRELSRTLEVSVPTLSAAIERLVRRGVLTGRGGRRRFRIASAAGRPKRAVRDHSQRQVLIVTAPGAASIQNRASTNVLQAFGIAMTRRGWGLRFAEVDFYNAQRPHRSWGDLLRGERTDRIIVLYGRESIGRWAMQTGVPTCFIGGATGDLPIPSVGISTHRLLEDALERLVAAGHRTFFLPLCRRQADFVARQRESYARVLARHGLSGRPEVEVPAPDTHTPETLFRVMDRAWSQPRPPTGLVFMDWRDCVSGLSFLLARGLRIPDDVSVVALSHEHQVDWFRPELAHYVYPEDGLLKALLRWIDGKGYNREALVRRTLANFVPGKSIAPPPAG